MFNRFKLFYNVTFIILPLFQMYPVTRIIYKSIKKNEWEYGLLAFSSGMSLFVIKTLFNF